MNIRYRVELSQSERDRLAALLSGGTHPARKLKRAQNLLAEERILAFGQGSSMANLGVRIVGI